MLKFNFDTYTEKYINKDYLDKLMAQEPIIMDKLNNHPMNGWLNNIEPNVLDDIINTAEEIKKNSDALVVIGIGGSYMGTYALDSMFRKYFVSDKFEIVYAGFNLSCLYTKEVLDYVREKNVTVNVISKSGTTLEPSIAYEMVMEVMREKYSPEELKKRIIITTDKEKGKLREEANREGYKSFIVPDNVGGRYSVLTPVGLLPLATVINVRDLLDGAFNGKRYIDSAYSFACHRICMFNSHRYIENFVSYEPKFMFFLEWLKQLFGESEGKQNKGILPTSSIYTRDLHSLGQFIQEGTPLQFETVIKIEDTEEVLYHGMDIDDINNIVLTSVCTSHYDHTPSMIITIDHISEYAIGELIYFFFLSASISAFLFGLDPFDQPGVEKYKNEVKKNLNL